MNVLIACEESQRVCEAFRAKGHTTYSCDIEKCGGEHPEWHINGDVLPLLSGIMSTAYRSPDQTIQPYMFGDPFEKKTCFWLKGLPMLNSTNKVKPPKRREFESGKTMPAWYADLFGLPKEERSKARSRTFPGVASAMAEQWGNYVVNNILTEEENNNAENL